MDSQLLYRVGSKDIEKVRKLLTVCFREDLLYRTLIPDENTRGKLLPELMECDVEEALQNCEIFADSPEINGALIVSDESEPYDPLKYYMEVFPEPLEPTTETNSPLSMFRLKSRNRHISFTVPWL